MPLTSHVGNQEISADPTLGMILGDVDPAITQDGVITKFRDADDENASDIDDNKAVFDPHDHGAAGGGQPIGTGGVIAIASNGIDNAALGSSSITDAKVQDGAVATAKIGDDTVEKAQLGSPKSKTKTGSGTSSVNFTFAGATVLPLFCIFADPGDDVVNVIAYSIQYNSATSITVGFSTGGLTVSFTCMAWGCTGIS